LFLRYAYKAKMDKMLSLSSIRKRKTSLLSERDEVELRLSDIDDELDQVDQLEKLVMQYGVDCEVSDDMLPSVDDEATLPFPTESPPSPRAKTNKEAILMALRIASDVWLTANELRERASKLKAKDIPMATISPTLTNLKNDRVIAREGFKVALISRLNENGEPIGSPDAPDATTPGM
jgi:hypothetical protein